MKIYIDALQIENGWLGLKEKHSKQVLNVENNADFRKAFSEFCDSLGEKNTKLSVRMSNSAPQYAEQIITDEVTSRSHFITSLNLSKTSINALQRAQNNVKHRSKTTTTALFTGLIIGLGASVLFFVGPGTILAITLICGMAAYSRERYSQYCASLYDTKGKLATVPHDASEKNALKIGVEASHSHRAYFLSFFKLSTLRHPMAFEAGKQLADKHHEDISIVNKIRKI